MVSETCLVELKDKVAHMKKLTRYHVFDVDEFDKVAIDNEDSEVKNGD